MFVNISLLMILLSDLLCIGCNSVLDAQDKMGVSRREEQSAKDEAAYFNKTIPEMQHHVPAKGGIFVIRYDNVDQTQLSKMLDVSKFVQYVSKNTVLVRLAENQLELITRMPGLIEIRPLQSLTKISGDLRSQQGMSASGSARRFLPSNKAILHVLVGGITEEKGASDLCEESQLQNLTCRARLATAGTKVIVDTDEDSKAAVAHALARHPLVTWVEERRQSRLRNKYASGIIQGSESVDIGSRPLWANGLLGDGEIIGPRPVPPAQPAAPSTPPAAAQDDGALRFPGDGRGLWRRRAHPATGTRAHLRAETPAAARPKGFPRCEARARPGASDAPGARAGVSEYGRWHRLPPALDITQGTVMHRAQIPPPAAVCLGTAARDPSERPAGPAAEGRKQPEGRGH